MKPIKSDMDWPKSDWEDVWFALRECCRKMQNAAFNCSDDERARRFAQDCADGIETWLENCKRKGGFTSETLELNSSKKPIKSSTDNDRVYSYGFDYIINYDVPVEQIENIILRHVQAIKEIEVVGNPGINNTSWSKEEYGITSSHEPIESSMPNKEKGIRAIMDEYGCSWEEAEEIMNENISSGCHDKSKKKTKKVENIEQSRRARNTEHLNKLYDKMM